MKRYLLLLLFPLLLATCTRNNDVVPDSKLIGRWSLVAERDSTGKWNAFIPFVPVIIEFKKDGSFNYIDTQGNPQNNCCQPTRYTFTLPKPCAPNESCLQTAGRIDFTSWVSCPTVNCALIKSWTTVSIDDTFLDVYAPPAIYSNFAFRYQRIN